MSFSLRNVYLGNISKLHNQTSVGRCFKTLKFVITIITWWVGVTKKWNCPLLFVTNLWCSHFFLQKGNFSTSQTRKKICFFLEQMLVFFEQLWNKKKFYCLAQQDCCLDKKKKNFWLCLFVFCFLHFGYLEEKTTLKKTKKNALVFF